MNVKTLLTLTLVAGALAACSPSHEKQAAQITALETRLFSPTATGFNKAAADSLTDLYAKFATQFPSDTISPHYLFKAAGICMNLQEGPKAIGFYDKILADYPSYSKAPLCLFFKGFVQENVMRNLDQAKETYLIFLEKYPNSDFADDAKAALANLGKTPDQLVREFDARRKADSLAAAKK